jgi:2,4-dienoyl-CoA reductase (NADPH2)
MNKVEYKSFSDQGLEVLVDGVQQFLDVDNVIVCAGQTSNNTLYEELKQSGATVHLIGGASIAAELDAKRAIRQGADLAAII